MPYPACRHLKSNGSRCQSPALTSKVWCYFHQHLHQRRRPALPSTNRNFKLPPVPDRRSVQSALSLVITALADGELSTRRAGQLLTALQMASRNAALLEAAAPPDAKRNNAASHLQPGASPQPIHRFTPNLSSAV
ncbi:hypothetical protein [Tunturiibacter gelidoferens]|uniref:Uncharacterized protein n=1 Tax=Tunturiibacter gelidiferens TaxID=3069689 RepID=A0ACC5NYS8_9BACT|nr:hypothetical protein [Edaphobacter lichenicola]MBB5339747.1 hypothetical protein [Edaphobacter lichenicola]